MAFGLSLVAFSFSRIFWLSTLVLVPVGFSLMTQMAATNTLIQSMVGDEFRGRVMSFYTMMFLGVAPLGSLLAGSLAQALGAPSAVRLMAGLSIISGTIFLSHLPRFRNAARPMLAAQGNLPEPPRKTGS